MKFFAFGNTLQTNDSVAPQAVRIPRKKQITRLVSRNESVKKMDDTENTENTWKEIFLGDVLQFQRGFDITKKEQVPGKIPIVSSSGVTSYHNQWKIKCPGVVIGRKGTLGATHYIDRNFWPHDTTLWIKNFKGNNPRFLYYFLQTMHFENFDTGSSNPTLNRNHLHKIKTLFPKLSLQKKIAAILSAYDDLIENNKRRIALLEKIAEEIYREWFVRMRFPRYEKVKLYKGIPIDWIETKIKAIINRKPFGRIYRGKELYNEGDVVVIDQSRSDKLGYYDGDPQHIASPDNPIILFGDHTCKMVLMTKPFSLAENVIPFLSKNKMPTYFLYHLIKDLAKTTEYKRHWTELTNKDVLIPYEHLQKRFDEVVKTNHKKIQILNKSTMHASNARDLLLTRLISGKLSVESLDIQFPPSMQNEQDVDHAKSHFRR
jgi:type I restriction enzyme S subunit